MASRTAVLLILTNVVLAMLSGCDGAAPSSIEVTIGGETFALEPALNEASREQGLMGRTDVPAGTGMIFVFPDAAIRSFWMKNCVTDIDLVFLDARGSVTAVHRMKVDPPRLATESERDYEARLTPYPSGRPAQFAVELPPGSIDRLGIDVDQRLELDLTRLKGLAQ